MVPLADCQCIALYNSEGPDPAPSPAGPAGAGRGGEVPRAGSSGYLNLSFQLGTKAQLDRTADALVAARAHSPDRPNLGLR